MLIFGIAGIVCFCVVVGGLRVGFGVVWHAGCCFGQLLVWCCCLLCVLLVRLFS